MEPVLSQAGQFSLIATIAVVFVLLSFVMPRLIERPR
jgi:hypothetical protein